MAEPQIVIVNREELNFLLSETSGLEHMVMPAYLFAAFSFKTDVSEGLTEEQLEAVKRWNAALQTVECCACLGWQGPGETARKHGSASARIPDTV